MMEKAMDTKSEDGFNFFKVWNCFWTKHLTSSRLSFLPVK